MPEAKALLTLPEAGVETDTDSPSVETATAPDTQVVSLKIPREFLQKPGIYNLNLWMCVTSYGLIGLSVVGYLRWDWSGWLCFGVNWLALHLVGTVIHDACHNAAHPNRWVNSILGHASGLLLGFSFPVFTRVHLEHHAHVNDPENDPDHFVSTTGPVWLIAPRFFYHEIYFFRRRLWRKYELLQWWIARMAFMAIVYLGFQNGLREYILNDWFAAALVVGLILGIFFDYLPHRPFDDRTRWRNARVYANPLLNLLVTGHNYHLVHHLWPSMPWYRYQPAYHATKALLDAKGSPQTVGIFDDKWEFRKFLYDLFLGIRIHSYSKGLSKSQTNSRDNLLN
jgi:beta-carotene hydroxylase